MVALAATCFSIGLRVGSAAEQPNDAVLEPEAVSAPDVQSRDRESGSVNLQEPAPAAREQIAPSVAIPREETEVEVTRTIQPLLAELEEAISQLPDFDGTDAGVRQKYDGLTLEELKMVYPLLRAKRKEEMFSALDSAIQAGLHRSEIIPSGGSMDFSRYRVPGDSFHAIAHRAEPHGSGGAEYKFVSFDLENYPEVYIRSFEETWVGDRIDEADAEGE
jgi:hypothetical protein